MSVAAIQKQLQGFSSREKARLLQRFFKTGPGDYAEGDVFIGVVVPDIRRVAKAYQHFSLDEITVLLRSPIHEERLIALIILVLQFQKADEPARKAIFDFYLAHSRYVNNWDLVDLSAPHIVGAFLMDKEKGMLRALAKSHRLWERRIAIVSTHYFIRHNRFSETLRIAKLLLNDEHDLIHKAVGWMLREVGKRNQEAEEKFLQQHYKRMPRTMLRYAIERFSRQKRHSYLHSLI